MQASAAHTHTHTHIHTHTHTHTHTHHTHTHTHTTRARARRAHSALIGEGGGETTDLQLVQARVAAFATRGNVKAESRPFGQNSVLGADWWRGGRADQTRSQVQKVNFTHEFTPLPSHSARARTHTHTHTYTHTHTHTYTHTRERARTAPPLLQFAAPASPASQWQAEQHAQPARLRINSGFGFARSSMWHHHKSMYQLLFGFCFFFFQYDIRTQRERKRKKNCRKFSKTTNIKQRAQAIMTESPHHLRRFFFFIFFFSTTYRQKHEENEGEPS